jgi:hypothetical protein
MPDLALTVEGRTLSADWTGDNPTTREALADALPLEGEATRWGEELYFHTPVDVPPEDAQTAVPVGAVAYWPGATRCVCSGGRRRPVARTNREPPRP